MQSMYDKELVIAILKSIISSMEQVLKRFEVIQSSSDFVKDDAGLEELDSICMQLIATGLGWCTWRLPRQIHVLAASKEGL